MFRIDVDQTVGVFYVTYKDGEVDRTVETRPGVYTDYDASGDVLGVEFTNAEAYATARKALNDLTTSLEMPTVA